MSLKTILSYVLFVVFITGTSTLFAQKSSNSVFKRANVRMTTTVTKHLAGIKNQPYKLLPGLRAGANGSWTDIYALQKAYDLNPNDLSFKVKDAQNAILIIFPLEQPVSPSQRLKYDALRDAKIRSILTNNENITEFKNKAGFIIIRNQLGNFEIQD